MDPRVWDNKCVQMEWSLRRISSINYVERFHISKQQKYDDALYSLRYTVSLGTALFISWFKNEIHKKEVWEKINQEEVQKNEKQYISYENVLWFTQLDF